MHIHENEILPVKLPAWSVTEETMQQCTTMLFLWS